MIIIESITISCEGDIPVPLPPYWGEASALKNGEVWKPKVLAGNLPGLDPDMNYIWINMDWYVPVIGSQQEGLGISELSIHHIGERINLNDSITLKQSNQTLGTYYTLQSDSKSGDQYRVLKSADNYAVLTHWDPVKLEVKGEFQCTFVRKDPQHPILLMYPDTVRFTKGTFHTRVHIR